VVLPPLPWRLANTLAETTDETCVGAEACHRCDFLHGPAVVLPEKMLCPIHSLIEQVLVRCLAGDSAEVSRKVKWTEMDLAGDLVETYVTVQICGDVFHRVAQLWERKTPFEWAGISRICCVPAKQVVGETCSGEISVEAAQRPALCHLTAQVEDDLLESPIIEGPLRGELRGWALGFVGNTVEQIGMNGENKALGIALPAEAVLCAGREKDHGAWLGVFDAVATGSPPLDGLIAGDLQVETEVAVLVLGNLHCWDSVMFEKEVAPGLIGRGVMTARHERNHLVVPEHRDPV
jgi:hypothetical protein